MLTWVFYLLSATVFIGLIAYWITGIFNRSGKQKKFANMIYISVGGIFVSAMLLFYPFTLDVLRGTIAYPIVAVILSAHNAIRLFIVDCSLEEFITTADNISEVLANLCIWLASFLYIIAPLLTAGAAFTLFKSLISRASLFFGRNKDAYIFSELNNKSLALAKDIRQHDPTCMLVFTDVYSENNEISCEQTEAAKAIHAIMLKNDIAAENFHKHSTKTKLYFFIIGTNDDENISQSIALCQKYEKPKLFKQNSTNYVGGYDYPREGDTRLFLFSEKQSYDLHLSSLTTKHIVLRRISPISSSILNILYERGRDIFFGINTEEAKSHPVIPINSDEPISNDVEECTFKADAPRPTGNKVLNPSTGEYEDERLISALVIGAGGLYGTEMIRALSWFCQMHPFKLEINAFDKSDDAASKLRSICPEMFDCNPADKDYKQSNKTYNDNFTDPGEAQYKISVYQGFDASLAEFDDAVQKLTQTSYVFVALGSDDENIKVATKIRILLRRQGINPVIHTIIYNSDNVNTLKKGTIHSGSTYGIVPLGSIDIVYSQKTLLNTDLEDAALARHNAYTKRILEQNGASPEERTKKIKESEDAFWRYDYNYRSNTASALHSMYKKICKLPGFDKPVSERNDKEKELVRVTEHRRWNAHLRSEGYVFSQTRDKLAKTHNLLVSFYKLDISEQEKDDD